MSQQPDSIGLRRDQLQFSARAGLLPELSRQTYDTVYKSLREAVLNAIDAGANDVVVDFSQSKSEGIVTIFDDGSGMTQDHFRDHFMAVGGSSKFGEGSTFGRIGIGSLAMLQYGRRAMIETKVTGADAMTRAEVDSDWESRLLDRRAGLGTLAVGTVSDVPYDGDPQDHFTRISIIDPAPELVAVDTDPASYFELVGRLRRVLPLSWSSTAVAREMKDSSPDTAKILDDHTERWSGHVTVRSSWDSDTVLTRRSYGDDPRGIEESVGPVHPVYKRLRVIEGGVSRRIEIAGFLISQKKALNAWSGITARVQNVAVEEATFFDVSNDPGFRRYITGEIFILGDVDTDRLINIDRASFNRESADYSSIQRYMAAEIQRFKSRSVQQPRRHRNDLKKVLSSHGRAIHAITEVCNSVTSRYPTLDLFDLDVQVGKFFDEIQAPSLLEQAVSASGAELIVDPEPEGFWFSLAEKADSLDVVVAVSEFALKPRVKVGRRSFGLAFAELESSVEPVVFVKKPQTIVLNLSSPALSGATPIAKCPLALALKLVRVLPNSRSDDAPVITIRLLEAL